MAYNAPQIYNGQEVNSSISLTDIMSLWEIILFSLTLVLIVILCIVIVICATKKQSTTPCYHRGAAEVIGYESRGEHGSGNDLCVKILDLADDKMYTCTVGYPIEATTLKKGDVIEVTYSDEYKLLGIMVRHVEIVKEGVSEEHYDRRYLQKQAAKAECGKDRLCYDTSHRNNQWRSK